MRTIIFISLLTICSNLKAQESIQTDRPDQTESTSTTPTNFLQIETGLFFEKSSDQSTNYSHPTVLWKYGINENFELRMVTEFNSENFENEKMTGLAPLTFGFKAKLVKENKIIPNISLVGHLTTSNWGSKNFQTSHLAPSFRFLFQHTLSEKVNFAYNLGAEWNGETPDATGIYSVSTSYSFTEKLGTFAELYGFLNKYEKADHRFDAGFTYLFNNNLMVDVSSGFGLSEISPEYFLSCGISHRFSTK